jgi:hypothetical protein
MNINGKAIRVQASTGPEGSRRLSLPDFKKINTSICQGCQPYSPAALTSMKYSRYILFCWSHDRVVGIATRYGLDGRGIESRWERDFPVSY